VIGGVGVGAHIRPILGVLSLLWLTSPATGWPDDVFR